MAIAAAAMGMVDILVIQVILDTPGTRDIQGPRPASPGFNAPFATTC